MSQDIKKMKFRTIEIPVLTRGIANNSSELIGNTPLVRLNNITRGCKAHVIVKRRSGITAQFSAYSV